MKHIKKIIKNKKFILLNSLIILILLSLVINLTLSEFSNRKKRQDANIKVAEMNYNIVINGDSGTKLTVTENNTVIANLIINALNDKDSKYELVYKVCSTSACNTYIEKPESLIVEYSSKTIDQISGSITKNGVKQIRIAATNTSTATYYIELGINAGAIYNTLALQNLITNEYNEEEKKIAAIIDGEISTTFPTTQGNYEATVTCTTNGGASNASGSITWNGTKWVLNVSGVDSGNTICNANFFTSFKNILLSQGGGSSAIEAKASPDFSKIAPAILTYKETTSTYTSSLSSNKNRAIGSGYTFDASTGRYTLTNYVTGGSYGTEYINWYTCASTSYSNCTTMYKINTVNGTQMTNSTRYSYAINTYNYSDTGLYSSADEYGTSYYYRGDKVLLKNNLLFGGFQWKIIRINGDGSLRLIYNGTETQFNQSGTMNDTGTDTRISASAWNSTNRNDAKYVGYMYGGANGVASTVRNGATSAAATYNETSTNIKTVLETWYQTNILGKAFENQIVNNLYCNDRQLRSEIGGAATGLGYGNTGTNTYYAPYQRLNTTKNPTLKCGLKNDRFTTSSDTVIGNGTLTYPIGLITADELAMGGLAYLVANSTNYLYTNENYWSFSPQYMNTSNIFANMFNVDSIGQLSDHNVDSVYGVRPVISISHKVKVTGDGSQTNPFRVIN